MDRVSSLLKSARELRRQIWASLPWGYRVARLLMVLANANAEAWGKTLYAMFLQRGVKGLPDVHGQMADQWFEALPESVQKNLNLLTRKLPSGFGSQFGHRLFKLALVIAKRPDKVDDEIQKLMEYLLKGAINRLTEGSPLKTAENYILNAVQNRAYNIQKEKSQELGRGQSTTVTDDSGAPIDLDIQDDAMVKDLDRELHIKRVLESPRTKSLLGRVHPDAMLFIELILAGYEPAEIVGNPKAGRPSMLPHFDETGQAGFNFIKTYVPKINETLLHAVAESQQN
jgi:hypothetical protein